MLRPEISYSDLESAEGLSPEEALFVLRLRSNEDSAYDELVRSYHAPLYRIACRMLQDPGEAADVTQDIFVKVFRNIGRFKRSVQSQDLDIQDRLSRNSEPNPLVPKAVPPIHGAVGAACRQRGRSKRAATKCRLRPDARRGVGEKRTRRFHPTSALEAFPGTPIDCCPERHPGIFLQRNFRDSWSFRWNSEVPPGTGEDGLEETSHALSVRPSDWLMC